MPSRMMNADELRLHLEVMHRVRAGDFEPYDAHPRMVDEAEYLANIHEEHTRGGGDARTYHSHEYTTKSVDYENPLLSTGSRPRVIWWPRTRNFDEEGGG